MDQAQVERNLRAWEDLMDFGWEFCLQVFPQLHPGCDPLQKLREAYDRMGRERRAANERMLAALGRAHGRLARCEEESRREL